MKILREKTRKGISLAISVLVLTLSVAVPVLERADLHHDPVAESEHDPLQCPPAHDHTICTQVTANLAMMASAHTEVFSPTIVTLVVFSSPLHAVDPPTGSNNRSRAPPLT